MDNLLSFHYWNSDNWLLKTGAAFLISFIIGSIPFGLIIGKVFYRKDIRELGSKNIGATNVLRSLGIIAGIFVLILDSLKGFLCVFIPPLFISDKIAISSILCGISAICGHNWSIFLKFKGGKGVATSIGVALALAPKEAGIAALGFIIIVFLTRYVSVGSIFASMLFLMSLIFFKESTPILFFGDLACLMILIKHIPNIKRLFKGTENKIWHKKSV